MSAIETSESFRNPSLGTDNEGTNGVNRTRSTQGTGDPDQGGSSTTQFNEGTGSPGHPGSTVTVLLSSDDSNPNAGYAPPPPPPPPDPKELLKDDATYQQLVSDLNQLQGIDFDLIERTYTSCSSPDGKLSGGDLWWATTSGDPKIKADAISLSGNPRLWGELDDNHDGVVSKDEFLAKIRSLKADIVSMEKNAVAEAVPTTPTTPGTTQPSSVPPMDAATAAEILLANFELLDSPTGNGKDDVSSWKEVLYVHDRTTDPKLKAAIEFFRSHQNEWHLMENLNSGKESLNDNVFSKDELTKYVAMKKASGSAGAPTPPSPPAPPATPSDPGSSTTTGSTRSPGGSSLEDARSRIADARDGVEVQIDSLAQSLADKTAELSVLESASPPDTAKIAALKADLSKAQRSMQVLTERATMLSQLEKELTEMIQNSLKMRHEMSMHSIQQMV